MITVNAAEAKFFSRALFFATFVVCYNIIEGIVSIIIGYSDESLTLFGFGVDSFIEVASNLGVIYMIRRIQESPSSNRTPFESTALKITGYGFYALSVVLAIGIVLSLLEQHRPENTFWGIIISGLSISVMYYVASSQISTGKKLNSQPIISDAKCTMVCVYMSITLLVSSFVYYTTGFAYADAIGAAGLIYFSVKEGNEAVEKSKGSACCHDC